MAFASDHMYSWTEAGPSTPRKTLKESYSINSWEAPEVDEALFTPLLEIPTEQTTPAVNWGDLMCKFNASAGSPGPETPNPFACGGSQASAAWSRRSAPLSGKIAAPHDLSRCANSFAPMPPPEVSAALKAAPATMMWEDPSPMSKMMWADPSPMAKLEASNWQQWLSNPPSPFSNSPSPFSNSPSPFPSSKMPWSLTSAPPAQQLFSPWNPAARVGAGGILLEECDPCTPRKSRTPPKNVPAQHQNEITPRKLVCSRDSTPPPTRRSSPPTVRSSPPLSMCRRSPFVAPHPIHALQSSQTPSMKLNYGGLLDEEADPCTPRKSRTPPKNAPARNQNEITPRKLVCSRESTPPPTRRSSPPTVRSSPPLSMCRASPLSLAHPIQALQSSQTPSLKLNYGGLLDEVESPWKLPKVDAFATDAPSTLSMCWPPPPISDSSLAWVGDPDASLSPAPRLGLKDQENRDPNLGRFRREFGEVTPFRKGKFSTVYRAAHKLDRQIYAVRAQEAATEMERQVLLREVAVIAGVCAEGPVCPNVLQYYSVWLEDASLHVQTELFECSLRDRLDANLQLSTFPGYRSKSEDTLKLLRDVASGLASLHVRGLAHTDVRPENILVTQRGSFKVGGLGRSTRLSVLGPPPIPIGDEFATDHYYRAPEALWLGGEYSELPKADVFSLALIVCEFAMSPVLFAGESCEWQQLRSGCLREALLCPQIPERLLVLLRRMLTAEPSERPACSQIAEHATELRLAGDQLASLQPSRGLSEAELLSSLRKQREEHLREGLRRAVEVEELQRERAEAARLELEALKKKLTFSEAKKMKPDVTDVGQQKDGVSLRSDLQSQPGQLRRRSSSLVEPKQITFGA